VEELVDGGIKVVEELSNGT